jgi:hypothetical protein
MHGLAKLATPMMRLAFEKLGDHTQKQMTQILTRL